MHTIRTMADADAHDWETPALVETSGRWVRAFMWLQEKLLESGAEGEMARSVEALLAGLTERESSLITMGLTHAMLAAPGLVREPEEVLEEVVREEKLRPILTVVRGGWEEPEVVEVKEEEPDA